VEYCQHGYYFARQRERSIVISLFAVKYRTVKYSTGQSRSSILPGWLMEQPSLFQTAAVYVQFARWQHDCAVADSAMGGQGGRPPIDQNLGLALATRFRHGGKFSLKSLTFGHFFV